MTSPTKKSVDEQAEQYIESKATWSYTQTDRNIAHDVFRAGYAKGKEEGRLEALEQAVKVCEKYKDEDIMRGSGSVIEQIKSLIKEK